VDGQPGLAVSGLSNGALTLWRRGGNAARPKVLANFTADLDGSLWAADGQFLGWLFADERALFDPAWLRSIGAGEVEFAGDAPNEGAEPRHPEQRQLEEELRHLEQQLKPGAGRPLPGPGEQQSPPVIQPPIPIVPTPGPSSRPGQAGGERAGPPASAPTGRRGNPMKVLPGTNPPAVVGGRYYTKTR